MGGIFINGPSIPHIWLVPFFICHDRTATCWALFLGHACVFAGLQICCCLPFFPGLGRPLHGALLLGSAFLHAHKIGLGCRTCPHPGPLSTRGRLQDHCGWASDANPAPHGPNPSDNPRDHELSCSGCGHRPVNADEALIRFVTLNDLNRYECVQELPQLDPTARWEWVGRWRGGGGVHSRVPFGLFRGATTARSPFRVSMCAVENGSQFAARTMSHSPTGGPKMDRRVANVGSGCMMGPCEGSKLGAGGECNHWKPPRWNHNRGRGSCAAVCSCFAPGAVFTSPFGPFRGADTTNRQRRGGGGCNPRVGLGAGEPEETPTKGGGAAGGGGGAASPEWHWVRQILRCHLQRVWGPPACHTRGIKGFPHSFCPHLLWLRGGGGAVVVSVLPGAGAGGVVVWARGSGRLVRAQARGGTRVSGWVSHRRAREFLVR